MAYGNFALQGINLTSILTLSTALGCASVAQRQSPGFVNRWLWVRIPPLASWRGRPSLRHKVSGSRSWQWTSDDSLLVWPLSGSATRNRHGRADGRAANGIRL